MMQCYDQSPETDIEAKVPQTLSDEPRVITEAPNPLASQNVISELDGLRKLVESQGALINKLISSQQELMGEVRSLSGKVTENSGASIASESAVSNVASSVASLVESTVSSSVSSALTYA